MPPFRKMGVPVTGILILAGVLPTWRQTRAETPAPPLIGEEMRHVRSDFAAGGIRKLSAAWNACVDQASLSQDANAAERCVVYGYGAVLMGDASGAAASTPWMRHLTGDMIAQGQMDMLAIMGIPEGPRQAWLDRYQRWVTAGYTPNTDGQDAGAADGGGPYGGVTYGGAPRLAAPSGGDARDNQDGPTDLAKATDGKYPRDALRQPDIADSLRRMVGQSLFSRLKNYDFGAPMEFTGQYTVGSACEPRACGVSEVRYVFSADDVWVGIIDGGRLRIYGDPPKSVRALLLRDRDRIVWRGPVEDANHPISPPSVLLAAEPAPRGPRPRMTISPHLIPVSADPMARGQPDGDATAIKLRDHDGTLVVPVLINNMLTVPFTIDSGASDVSVSAAVMEKLMRWGTLSGADFLGKQIYHLADGSAVSSETFRIHTLKVGDREVRDVMGSVTNDADGMLLGQSFLTRFRSWSIDNQRQMLLLK